MKEKKINNWIISIIINAIIIGAILVATRMSYETNDDFAIASRIAAGYPFVGFVNYYLCKAIIALQSVIPALNWFVIVLIATSFVAFTCILNTIFEAGDSLAVKFAATAVTALYAFDHYGSIQFTKTAALVMTAGMLMLASCITEKKGFFSYAWAVVMIYLGASIRVDALIGAAGFAGIYGIVWLITNRKRLIPEGYITPAKVLLYVVLIALIGGAYEFDRLSDRINVSTDELKYAEEYSLYRSNIVDYPTYEYYEENVAAYDAIGISENDIYLIDHWVFDYDGAASLENLRKIDSIERHEDGKAVVLVRSIKKCIKDIYRDIRKMSFTGIHIILLLCIALWSLFALRPGQWLYTIAIGAMAVALYMAVYYMQRPAYRALYVADIGATVWLIYYLMQNSGSGSALGRSNVTAVMGAAVGLIALMLMLPAYAGTVNKAEAAAGKVMSETMQDYFTSHEDNFYVWTTTEKKLTIRYLTPWLAPDGSDCNVTGTGGWGVLSPYMLDRLGDYGIYNPVKDLIDNDKAFFIANKRLGRYEEYYNKWYASKGEKIILEEADNIDGRSIWKVRRIKIE